MWPATIVVSAAAVGLVTMSLSIHDHREQARTEKVDFTERDRQTLVSE